MKQKLFLLIGSISFFSCSQERLTEGTDDTLSVDEVSATTQSLLIDKDAVSLTSVDAKNVAALFRSKNGGASSRSASDLASESASVETIVDSATSEPLLYIVNWADDGGFVVVSASKKCFPVACYSETGNFSLDADPASKLYIEEYKQLVRDGLSDISMLASDKYSLVSVTSTTYSDYPVTVYPPSTLANGNYGEYFYMNMGWGGCNNGWYRSNSYNASDSDRSFTTDQKIITVEK